MSPAGHDQLVELIGDALTLQDSRAVDGCLPVHFSFRCLSHERSAAQNPSIGDGLVEKRDQVAGKPDGDLRRHTIMVTKEGYPISGCCERGSGWQEKTLDICQALIGSGRAVDDNLRIGSSASGHPYQRHL